VTKLIVDTSVWIEYFADSARGKQVASLIDSPHAELFVPASVIAEVVKIHIDKKKDPVPVVEALQNLSSIVPLDVDLAFVAAKLYNFGRIKNSSFGMLDAFVIATAREVGGKVLTFDNSFRPFKETIIPV